MIDSIQRLLAARKSLKAKEIANELGISKTEVNAALYSNRDRYQIDQSYRWSLIQSAEVVLTLPERWVTAESLEAVFVSAGQLLDGPNRAARLFVPRGCKLMIDCTARLLSLLNQLTNCGKATTLDFTASEGTKDYLDRAGFFDQLDKRVVVLPSRPDTSAAVRFQGQSATLVEFGSVDPLTDNAELIEALTEKFVQQSSASYRVAAFTVFSELVGNVTEHSNSPLKGFAGLQIYSGSRRHIQTVVSDSGIGIADTLRPALKEHYPGLFRQFSKKSVESDIGLVTAAMSQGNVSRFGGARGLGFKSSRAQAIKFHANFSVRQERFCVRFDYRDGDLVQTTPQRHLSRIMGTHICFDFFVD